MVYMQPFDKETDLNQSINDTIGNTDITITLSGVKVYEGKLGDFFNKLIKFNTFIKKVKNASK